MLGDTIERLDQAGCDLYHFDIVDGHFARVITFGPFVQAALRDVTSRPFTAHLAVQNPKLFLEEVAASGADIVTAQIEACPNAFRAVRRGAGPKGRLCTQPSNATRSR
jgi:ribulose-phosphate 3-epimerase